MQLCASIGGRHLSRNQSQHAIDKTAEVAFRPPIHFFLQLLKMKTRKTEQE